MPKDAKTFLDVGCGSGRFGSAIKNFFSGSTVWGAEIDPSAADAASQHLDKVIQGDITQSIEQVPDHFFDCIIFNDSLEHIAYPCTLLRQLTGKLTSSGVIVSSIPNVRYYKNLYNLLFRKQWRYEDGGILDRTHLRFFTYKSIIDMFNKTGYDVELIEGINPTRKDKVRFLIFLSLGWLSDIRYLQFVTRAKPKDA